MAVAVAASPAVPVSAPMLAQVQLLACGRPLRRPAAPAGSIGVARCPDCPDCVDERAADSIHAVTLRRARNAARDGDWNEAAELWREALLIDDRAGAHWLAMGDVLLHAERHREVIRRVGRCPHRNEILGRASRPEEVEFLRQPGSRF